MEDCKRRKQNMQVEPNHKNLLYSGRIDFTNPQEPVFVFPCTNVSMRFTGRKLSISVKNKQVYWDNYLGYLVDGKQSAFRLPQNGSVTFSVNVEETKDDVHEVMLFKRQDSCHVMTFLGFEIGEKEEVLSMPPKTNRRIEVFGDSVSAGEVSEALLFEGKEDPAHNGEYSNSWFSYAWMMARRLNAQIHNTSQGGIALMDQTGWFLQPEAVGMETVWDKIHYNPFFGKSTTWDFSLYIPQVVIVALGQNDSHPIDYMKENGNEDMAIRWKEHYKAFLKQLRTTYLNANIICCTTLLCHDISWDNAIGQAVSEMQDKKITQYLFQRNGKGTPGHLRIPEAKEMAEELVAYIESLSIEGW